jgi:hypothetical protein
MAKEWPDYQDVELCFELFRQKAQNGRATVVTDDDGKKALRAIETRATELQTKRAYQVKRCVTRALQSAALNLAYTLLINEATLSKCIATFAAILATNVVEGVAYSVACNLWAHQAAQKCSVIVANVAFDTCEALISKDWQRVGAFMKMFIPTLCQSFDIREWG